MMNDNGQTHWAVAHPEAIHLDRIAADRARAAALAMRARCIALVMAEGRAASTTNNAAWLARIAREMGEL